MKNRLLIFIGLVCSMSPLFGSDLYSNARLLDRSETLVAPVVPSPAAVAGPQVGQIIYDENTNLFKGMNNLGSWLILSSQAAFKAPTISTVTSATCTGGFAGCTGTYTLPSTPVPLYIRVEMVGGGGGGAGASTSTGAGSAGGSTTFGPTGSPFLTANGGNGGETNSTGGSGGSASITSGSTVIPVIAVSGGYGSPGMYLAGTLNVYSEGGTGANSPFGGGGAGGLWNASGTAASPNTGSGGGGGGSSGATNGAGGAGGGSGGYLQALLTAPANTNYTVGSSGPAGGNGGAGAGGMIIVTEYYQ